MVSVLGLTKRFSWEVYYVDIWNVTRNEEEFIKLFSKVVGHEVLHCEILKIMEDSHEKIVEALL